MDRRNVSFWTRFIIQVTICVWANGETIKNLEPKLEKDLNTTLELANTLVEDICLDLDISGEDEESNFTQVCEENFLSPSVAEVPPELQIRCQFSSHVCYSMGPSNSGAQRLVVLTPVDIVVHNLPYDIMVEGMEFGRINLDEKNPGQYQTWSTLMTDDGRRAPWRRGPALHPWNETGRVRPRDYQIQYSMTHQIVKNASRVKTVFSWNSFGGEDACFHVFSSCNGQPKQYEILPNQERTVEVTGQPLDSECEIRLTGKYGETRRIYRTPKCADLPRCTDKEKVQNLTIDAKPDASGTVWEVQASWLAPYQRPLQYNVTLSAEHLARTLMLPGNMTSVSFNNVDDTGLYYVSIGAVYEKYVAFTSERAMFPTVAASSTLGAGIAGSWSAVVALAALSGAGYVLWRRRRANRLRHIYFQDQEDKLQKDATCDTVDPDSIIVEDGWEVRSERLLLHEVIGEGAFGVVRRGTMAPAGKEVAVKMLKEFPTLEELRSFRAEMELMKSVGAHPHVVSLVGCCSGRRPLIVAEYCSRGDLLSFLRCSWDVMVSKRNVKYYNNNIESSDYRNDLFKCKPQENSKLVVNKMYDLQDICDTELTARDLLSFCRQIAMGMEFLASNRLVHRDLAARNVLVTGDRTLKIADFGLSRDVYEENLYKQKGNGKMPMKWMALESLTHRIYTTQSDVWSFGVVMWEILTVGASPYPGVPAARLPRLLRAGYRMPRPALCTAPVYEVMLSCWHAHPRARPTFGALHARLDELLLACADEYLALQLDPAATLAHPHPHTQTHTHNAHAHRNLSHIIRNKLRWSRGESYERPLMTVQSNHYSSPPA